MEILYKRILLILCITFLSVGCSSIVKIKASDNYDKKLVNIVDHRTKEQKQRKRESVFSAVVRLDEKSVQPKAIDVLVSKLATLNTPQESLDITVDEFFVLDYFPTRMAPIAGGFIGSVLVQPRLKEDEEYLNSLKLDNSGNSIICVFSGLINKNKIINSAIIPYKTTSQMIRSDPAFEKAVSTCLEELAVALTHKEN